MRIKYKYHIYRQRIALSFVKVLFLCLVLGLPVSYGHAYDGNYPSLRDCIDPVFQAAFEKTLEKQFGKDLRGLAKAKKIGIVLADITDRLKPKVAEVNGDVMLYAASLPKIAIVLGVFVEMERAKMKMDDETKQLLIATVRKSSNKAATKLLHRVGFENLAEILQSERYRLYDPKYGGGLWVGRDYGGGPVWKRDPLNNISHAASAMQTARYYYMGVTKQMRQTTGRDGSHNLPELPESFHDFSGWIFLFPIPPFCID